MKKLYVILREHFFEAASKGQIPEDAKIIFAGQIWIEIFLTEEEAEKYTYPKSLA